MGVQDITCTGLARKMGDMTVDEEVPSLFTNLAKVCAFDPSDFVTLHAVPQLGFKHSIPQGFWTIPRALENARREM